MRPRPCSPGGGDLSCERRRLTRALETGRAGGLPRDHVALLVGESDDRVVEARLDVRLADRNVLTDAAAGATTGRCGTTGRRHYFAFFPRPTVFFGPLRVRAFVFVRWPCVGSPRRWRRPRGAEEDTSELQPHATTLC